MQGHFSNEFFTGIKPIERKAIVNFVDSLTIDSTKYSKADQFNLQYLMIDNWEWSNAKYSDSKKPILKYFYKKKSDMFSIHNSDFDLHVNPVVYVQLGKETASSDMSYINTRGIELRGIIDNKVGFYAFAADNQAMFPTYTNEFISNFHPLNSSYAPIPGQGFNKSFKKHGYDFLTARGYITFNVTKHIHVQFGHDQNFIGNGYRSLILSDFSPNYTFLKLNLKVWKLNYQSLFAELIADPKIYNQVYPKKYLAFHHIGLNITKNFNVGLFESVMFGRSDSTKNGTFDINYLNPIIFYRATEQHLGSGDNAFLGMDYKWNFLRHFSLYGQILLDEFLLHEVKAGNGWWGNKQAIQTGLKYINALGVKNLDLQGEVNVVRPYTYQHANNFTNYTNYDQPLAHPLGANFYEFIGIARYQPLKRLNVVGKLFYQKTGRDTSYHSTSPADNFGGNPLKSYDNVQLYHNYGNKIAQGIKTDIIYVSLTATYQLRHNLFVDLTAVHRKSTSQLSYYNFNTTFASVSIRWNIPQRLQEF